MINYEKIFQHLPDMFAILKADHPLYTIVDANETYLKTTGKKREDIIGKSIFAAFNGNLEYDDELKVIDSLHTCLKCKQLIASPIVKYDIDGVETYWTGKTVPILNDEGEVEYLVRCPMKVVIPKAISAQ